MIGKCTVIMKKEICTHEKFVQILVNKVEEFLSENIIILDLMQSSMNQFIFYYKRMKGVSM